MGTDARLEKYKEIDEALKPSIIKIAHMNSDTYKGSTQSALVYQHLQSLRSQYRDELENIVRVLASITNISPEQVKPYMDTLLRELVNKQEERPFHETATASFVGNSFPGVGG